MKKWQKITLIVLGSLLGLIILLNIGLNLWLKYGLPDTIKKNSDYRVDYSRLDVDLMTGNILAEDIKIGTKNPEDKEVLGIEGTVDTLKISRLGLIKAATQQRINFSDLQLAKPNLKITLAKKDPQKEKKKQSIPDFDNVKITGGNVVVLNERQSKVFSGNNLNINLQDLNFVSKPSLSIIPFVFGKLDIHGDNIFFRSDDIYAMKATEINTDGGQIQIKNYELIPLLTHQQFMKFYPKKRNLFDLKTKEVIFTDFKIDKEKLKLENVTLSEPRLKLYTTTAKTEKKEQSFKYKVNLENAKVLNGKVDIIYPDGNTMMDVENLGMEITKIFMDEQTAKGNIPFNYEKFKITGKDLDYFSHTQHIAVNIFAINKKSADLRQISLKPLASNATTTIFDLNISRARLLVNDWSLENDKLKMDAEKVEIDEAKGKIMPARNPKNKKADYSGIAFPLKLKTFALRNSDIILSGDKQPLAMADINATLSDIIMDEASSKNKIPFRAGDYNLDLKSINYEMRPFYRLSSGKFILKKHSAQLRDFKYTPLVTRAQYVRMIPHERDLYDIKAGSINITGDWDLFSDTKIFNGESASIDGVVANIFRSKIPPDDLSEKPMYSAALRKIKFPFFLKQTKINNAFLEYEEDTKNSDGPGKLTFSNLNMDIRNLNSGKMKGKPTEVPIDVSASFMKASPLKVKWIMNTAAADDAFSISGTIHDLPAPRINPFVEPYLGIRTTGTIELLKFDFRGNKEGIRGTEQLHPVNLRVQFVNDEGGVKKLATGVANIFISGNKSEPKSADIGYVQRDKTKSFFNMFWKGVQEGLAKILISKNLSVSKLQGRNTPEGQSSNDSGKKSKADKKAEKKARRNESKNSSLWN
ncbi:hypothetical protein SAMN05443429_107116 [Cruoricaptor ignavus]|uniref:AsmA-like C-terminal region n=1 Tax=Cruoricaptor ignavus TaxID=1118202 RepID=A0A1M6FSC1_9FLAO|nr:hypothetical protein [Cruoricaptor ignavus]SHJ00595.1 hypothetical protein SAMN05443429_107116 [Cruoricaptor ignavus]